MDDGRREILKSALAFANQAALQTNTADPEPQIVDESSCTEEPLFPSAETLHFILNGPSNSITTTTPSWKLKLSLQDLVKVSVFPFTLTSVP